MLVSRPPSERSWQLNLAPGRFQGRRNPPGDEESCLKSYDIWSCTAEVVQVGWHFVQMINTNAVPHCRTFQPIIRGTFLSASKKIGTLADNGIALHFP